MRAAPWLLGCCCIAARVWTAHANVEKAIFVAPAPATVPVPSLAGLGEWLHLATLEPARASLPASLAVAFPSATAPRGVPSWYLLRGLEQGRRYEVRLCWPATSPTDFWLDTFPLAQVLESADLTASLSTYIDSEQHLALPAEGAEGAARSPSHPSSLSSALLLRIHSAAAFYSANRTLMGHPPAVPVDIILDPFIFNILPQSLAPIAAYVSAVAVGAWFLSAFIYRWLLLVAAEPPRKLD